MTQVRGMLVVCCWLWVVVGLSTKFLQFSQVSNVQISKIAHFSNIRKTP